MSCTIKLILPCQACIDTAHIAGAMDIAESDARTLGLYGAEIKGITVNIYRGTALIGVEQLAIQINSIVTAQLLQLADTNMSTPILGTVVIAYIMASPYIAAAGIAKVSPVAFFPYLYYAWALALMVIASIVFRFPRHCSSGAAKA